MQDDPYQVWNGENDQVQRLEDLRWSILDAFCMVLRRTRGWQAVYIIYLYIMMIVIVCYNVLKRMEPRIERRHMICKFQTVWENYTCNYIIILLLRYCFNEKTNAPLVQVQQHSSNEP